MQRHIKQPVHKSTLEPNKSFPRCQSKLSTKNMNEAISRLKNRVFKNQSAFYSTVVFSLKWGTHKTNGCSIPHIVS